LSVGEVNGYPVIFRTGEFEEGALAGYAPVDSIFPDLPKYQFLGSNRRIKAKRLRGIFSMGLLVPCRPGWELGQNIQEELGITKWEPTIPVNMQGDNASDKGVLPVYTDIEGFCRFPDVLIEGGEVVFTEKTHGVNFRAGFHDNELIVGSHHQFTGRGLPALAGRGSPSPFVVDLVSGVCIIDM
jgi:RNA ligase (TIGR02306 family)